MSMADAQERVAAFVRQHRLEVAIQDRLLDLVSEVGELSKEVLKGTAYGRKPFVPGDDWAEEWGDVFFSLLCVANSTGVDAEKALSAVLDKYRDRLAQRGEISSGR
ncbi:MazG nucleotide pyrophosphohydrolase domain-containing protein [Brevibacillus sp. SYP-B805]|uniref:MazG nucleotide pyrophosphohydrolase domain-containing protein n=1 Tax=Brevibacillus sp. SYP-B805 TaxID=1578199 RepID=UPI0019D020D4|nr:MazG nucleotide pyrophosphohydrolase domain-containing protein [Brevibacillus sp. SYP-B805]